MIVLSAICRGMPNDAELTLAQKAARRRKARIFAGLSMFLFGVPPLITPWTTRASQPCTDLMLSDSSPQDCASESDLLY